MAFPPFQIWVDLVHRASNKYHAADTWPRLQTTGADINPIDDNFPVTVFNTDTTDSTKARLNND